jgi:signal transduction histidine kinase
MVTLIPVIGTFFLVIHIILFWKQKKLKEETPNKEDVLSKLEDIILSSITDFNTVAQQVSDAVAFDLGFKVGVILIHDPKKNVLKRVAVSRTEKISIAVNKLGFHFQGLETPLTAKDNITVQVFLDGHSRSTKNVYDVLKPHVTAQQAKYIQDVGELSSSLVFPIEAKGRIIGVMIFSLSVHDPELSEQKKIYIEKTLKMVGVALDSAILYSELKQTSEDLKNANVKLQLLDKLKDDFVSIASHELRTPMTAIRSYAWMALNRSDIPLSEKMKKYLSRTLISTERLINLVNDMLNVSRIESGSVEIKPTAFGMNQLVQDVFEEINLKAQEKNIHLSLNKTNIPKVFADSDKVHQILLNLIGNALKFTPAEGNISVTFFADGQNLDTTIKDSGVGISKEDLSKLFRKFERLDNSYVAAATTGGTGLGLYICRLLAGKMGGKIWAHSEGLGKGTAFTFSLPIASNEILSHPEKYTIKPIGPVKPLESVAL